MKTSRRNFLQKLSVGSLAAIAVPSLASASNNTVVSPQGAPDEKYWTEIKSQFMVPPNLTMMNAANLCPSPKSVFEKMQTYQKQLSGNVSMQYRAVFTERRKKSIELLAKFINAESAEVGITRNTSESNCTIINGLDLKAGDEVVLWDQNHPSNKEIWQKRAARIGLTIKMVSTPVDPASPSELAATFANAFTSKTRVVAFSQISNTTGIALPAKQICDAAKSKGVMTLVDGAQTLGFHKVDVKDLGCDFYTASTHKWLMGPLENGVLYMKKEHIEKVWPNIIGGGWHDNTSTVDEKICFLGQRNDPSTAALPEIIEFHETIGRDNINQRVVDLNRMLKEKIKQRLPKAMFVTPISPAMSGGIVIISVPDIDPKIIVQKLYDNHGIAVATTGGVRMSPHIYNTAEDIDRLVEALARSTS